MTPSLPEANKQTKFTHHSLAFCYPSQQGLRLLVVILWVYVSKLVCSVLCCIASISKASCIIIYSVDAKIQEIANSTTMQTVSSTLAMALAEAEASQSRSMQITHLGTTLESKSTFDETEAPSPREKPSPKQSPFQTKRLRDAVSYQIGGHCFRADDDSSTHTPPETEEDEHAKDISLTRLQFVVTSVFGLREAARNRCTMFEHHALRLLMTSIGSNIIVGGETRSTW